MSFSRFFFPLCRSQFMCTYDKYYRPLKSFWMSTTCITEGCQVLFWYNYLSTVHICFSLQECGIFSITWNHFNMFPHVRWYTNIKKTRKSYPSWVGERVSHSHSLILIIKWKRVVQEKSCWMFFTNVMSIKLPETYRSNKNKHIKIAAVIESITNHTVDEKSY